MKKLLTILILLILSSCIEPKQTFKEEDITEINKLPHQVFIDLAEYKGDTLVIVKDNAFDYYFKINKGQKPKLVAKYWNSSTFTILPKAVLVVLLVLVFILFVWLIIKL